MLDRVRLHRRRMGALGCLFCNTAVELGQSGSLPARRVAGYFVRLRELMERALQNAANRRQLAGDTDITELTDYLLGVFAGSALLARARMEPRMIDTFIATALETLDCHAPADPEDTP